MEWKEVRLGDVIDYKRALLLSHQCTKVLGLILSEFLIQQPIRLMYHYAIAFLPN